MTQNLKIVDVELSSGLCIYVKSEDFDRYNELRLEVISCQDSVKILNMEDEMKKMEISFPQNNL